MGAFVTRVPPRPERWGRASPCPRELGAGKEGPARWVCALWGGWEVGKGSGVAAGGTGSGEQAASAPRLGWIS